MTGADLLVELVHAQPMRHPLGARPIVARLVPGQPGVRFDAAAEADIVSLGFPEITDLLFFRPIDDVTSGHNAVTGPLAELIRARGVARVFFSEAELFPCIRKAAGSAPCRIHFGGDLVDPSEFRHRLDARRVEPGSHWAAWLGAR